MYTSVLLVALVGPGAAPVSPEGPRWQASYSAGLAAAREQGKPVAVFVGNGTAGWQKVSADGLSAEARKVLDTDYVCVYVDASEPKGQKLAAALEISTGLVLSTKNGENQAFSHDGPLTSSDLERSLKRYATGAEVTQTEYQPRTRVAYSMNANSVVPTTISGTVVAPSGIGSIGYATYPATTSVMGYTGYAPVIAGSYAAPSYTHHAPSFSYGEGCPGGRCGR